MTHRLNLTAARIVPVMATAALIGSACGSTTASNARAEPAATSAVVEEVALAAPTTDASEPVSTDAVVHATPSTEPTDTTPTPESGSDDLATPTPPATCGDFGPIPPRPDSMPTLQFDSDGDGADDDEVTAYGAIGGWVLRVVENGVISEASMPDIMGWAYISNDYEVNGSDYVEVTDNDLDTIYTFATVDGCVELLDTRDPIDDLAPTPDPGPAPTGPSDLVAVAGSCGDFGLGPANASIVSEIFVDLAGDGTPDDQVVTFFDDTWTLRTTVAGVISEVDVNGVGPGAVRALGIADVGDLTAGSEIIASTGAGASATIISVFGIDDSNCVFRFVDSGGSDLEMVSGASVGNGSIFSCGPGYVASDAWNLQDDDTYSMHGAAFIESTLGQFTYMPSSDYFDDFLTADDLPTDLFDCNGLSL